MAARLHEPRNIVMDLHASFANNNEETYTSGMYMDTNP
jgi:hypothetical protein